METHRDIRKQDALNFGVVYRFAEIGDHAQGPFLYLQRRDADH
jgi:hypothetical protein